MKKSIVIITNFIILMFFQIHAQTWSPANRLTWKGHLIPPDGSKNAAIAVDSNDNIYIFYQANADLYQKKSTDGGVTWLPVKRLTWNLYTVHSSTAILEFKVRLDSNDNIYIFIQIAEDLYLKKSSDGGANWQPLKRITWINYSKIYEYKVLFDSNNNIYLVWYRGIQDAFANYEIFIKKSTDGGTTWSLNRLTWDLDWSKYPEIVADSNDNIYVFWLLSGWNGSSFVDNIFYKRVISGSQKGFAKRLTWTTTDTEEPEVAIDSNNNLHVIWIDNVAYGFPKSLFHKRSTDGGLTWSVRTDLTKGVFSSSNYGFIIDGSSSSSYQIIVDTNDNIHVILSNYYTRSEDGGITWSELKMIPLGSGIDSTRDIELDSNNNLHLVWSRRDNYYDNIFYIRSRNSGDSWSLLKKLSWTTTLYSLFPDLSIDSNNNLHLVWQQELTERGSEWYEIYYKNRK